MNNLISSDVFNKPKSLITKLDFLEFDDNLSKFERNTISISLNIDKKESIKNKSGIIIEEHIFQLLVNEINQSIYKEITKRLFDTAKFDYIDLNKGDYVNQMQAQRAIVDKIMGNKQGYSSLISTGNMCTNLSDVSGFNFNYTGSVWKNNGAILNIIGNLRGIDVYNDPYMRYMDGRICLLDKVKINVKDFEFKTDFSIPTLAHRTLVKYDLAIDVGDSKIIFVIGGDFEDTSGQLKKLRRDIKLDSLLNGEKTN